MQNTLEEVELNAVNPSNVFGANHSKALEELRTAQIALAQAWARSETQEEKQNAAADEEDLASKDEKMRTTSNLATDRAEKLAGQSGQGSGSRPRRASALSNASDRTQFDADTENDIKLARKRREANDRYFEKVNAGVLDVVAKLDEVAKAMKRVEQESQEIWGDTESIQTPSTVS